MKGDWLKGNLVAPVEKREKPVDPLIQRLLPVEGVSLAFEAIAVTKSPLKRARERSMVSLVYLTGLRTFEATLVDMSILGRASNGQWWLMVQGKRNGPATALCSRQ